ncbi:MAG TPA: hypothetical protein VD794_05450 [Flavisolibacter sp.]|nr:hypothetical protein [Flavisolibacter sp.]
MKRFIYLLLACLVLVSCSEVRKTQKAITQLQKHPDKLAELCANEFPNVDSVGETDTVFIRANNPDLSPKIDSLSSYIDSLRNNALNDSLEASHSKEDCQKVVSRQAAQIKTLSKQAGQLKTIYVPCVPDTLKLQTTVYRENTAKVTDLNNKLIKAQNELASTKEKLGNRTWSLWIIIILIAGYIALRVIKRRVVG